MNYKKVILFVIVATMLAAGGYFLGSLKSSSTQTASVFGTPSKSVAKTVINNGEPKPAAVLSGINYFDNGTCVVWSMDDAKGTNLKTTWGYTVTANVVGVGGHSGPSCATMPVRPTNEQLNNFQKAVGNINFPPHIIYTNSVDECTKMGGKVTGQSAAAGGAVSYACEIGRVTATTPSSK